MRHLWKDVRGSLRESVTLVLVAILLFVTPVVLLLKAHGEASYLGDQVAPFVFPTFTTQGGDYEVIEGVVTSLDGRSVSIFTQRKVLRLAYHTALTRTDPLFALPDTNLEEYEISVSLLEASLNDIVSLYEVPEDREKVSRLYPLEFLKALGELEERRRWFLAHPSEKDLMAYYREARNIASIYRTSLGSVDVLLDAPEGERNRQFGNFGGVTTVEKYISVFEELRKESVGLQQSLKQRKSCAAGNFSKCPELEGHLGRSLSLHAADFDTESSPVLPTIVRKHLRAVDAYYYSNDLSVQRLSATPIVALHESSCFAGGPTYYGVYWSYPYYGDNRDGVGIQLGLLSDVIFYDVPENKSDFFKSLLAQGSTTLFQEMANIYLCPNSGIEVATVSNLAAIKLALTERPIFAGMTFEEPAYQELSEIEKEIVQGAFVSDALVSTYLRRVEVLLDDEGEHRISRRIGNDKVLQIEELILSHRAKTTHFAEIVNNAAGLNGFVSRIFATGSIIPPRTLFTTRGYPAISYMLFNATIVSDTPSFLNQLYTISEGREILGQKQYHTYEEMEKKGFSFREIVELMKVSRDIQRGLPVFDGERGSVESI